jgi:hypothetical protein
MLTVLSSLQTMKAYPFQISNELEFDGKGGHLEFNNTSIQSQFSKKGITLSIWVMIYPQKNQGQNPIVGQQGYQFYLDCESSGGSKFTWIVWNSKNNGTYSISPDTINYFRWYSVVGTWNANSGVMRLYVNGERVSQVQGPTAIKSPIENWLVGRNDNNYSLSGRTSNLQIYSTVLSETEITSLFAKGREGSPITSQNLIESWNLNGDFIGTMNYTSLQKLGDVRWIENNLLVFPFDIISVSFVYLFVASIVALLPYFPFLKRRDFFISIRDKYHWYVIAIFMLILVAILTPLSQDFLNILHTSSFNDLPIGLSPQEGGFWFIVIHTFSSLWRFLPVSHPNIQAAFAPPFDIYNNLVPQQAGSYLVNFFFGDGASGLFAWVLLAKLPCLLLDIGIAVLIYKILIAYNLSKQKATVGSLFWLLNPGSILLIAMFASNDALVIFLLLASVYYLMTGKKFHSALFYGLSIAVRLIPIIFLPFMLVALTRTKENLEKQPSNKALRLKIEGVFKYLLYLSIIGLTFLFSNLPMLASKLPLFTSPSSGPSSLLLSSQSFNTFFGVSFSSTAMNLYGFRLGLTVILFTVFLLFATRMWCLNKINTSDVFFLLLLVLFLFTNWNPQYWVWIFPFIIIKIKISPEYKSILALLIAMFISINLTYYSYYYSTWGSSFFFFPNYNGFLQSLSSFMFSIWNSPIYLGLRIDELLFSVFAGIEIWIIGRQVWSIFKSLIIK